MTNKWIRAAVKYKLPLLWQKSYAGFELYAMTYMAENGGHKYRQLAAGMNINQAMLLSIELYNAGGRLDVDLLISDTWWEFGWSPEISIPLSRSMMDVRAEYYKIGRNDQAEWQAFQDWRKQI